MKHLDIPTAITPFSSDIAMSSSSSSEQDTHMDENRVSTKDCAIQTDLLDTFMREDIHVATRDTSTQTEVEDIAMVEETLVARVDQEVQTDIEDVTMIEETPPTVVMDQGTQTEWEDDTTTIPSQTPDIVSPSSDTNIAIPEQDVDSRESIIAQLMDVIRKEKQEAIEAEGKKQSIIAEKMKHEEEKQEVVTIEQAEELSKAQEDPQPVIKQQGVTSTDPSSSRSQLKRPLERGSDSSDPESNDDNKDKKQEGVPGVTPTSEGANVSQQIDMPWFIARWNKNKKRIFKPNKFVKRLKRKHDTDGDAGPSGS